MAYGEGVGMGIGRMGLARSFFNNLSGNSFRLKTLAIEDRQVLYHIMT